MRVSFLLSLVCLLSCGGVDGGNNATMSPGEDCTSSGCHEDFSLGGTVYASGDAPVDQGLEGVTVTIVDSEQKTLTLTSNRTGNFYSKEPVAWPAEVTLTRGAQSGNMVAAGLGACNYCHSKTRASLIYLE